jgi:tetratricopeptide (TPR) repeat protein
MKQQNAKMTTTMTTTTPTDDYPSCWEYIFGFGSIINTATHAPWLSSSTDGTASSSSISSSPSSSVSSLPGQRATVKASWGYRRGWCFRSNTGFTALGIVKCKQRGLDDDNDDGSNSTDATRTPAETLSPSDINGVVFRVSSVLLKDFDLREVGYDRVEVPKDQIVFLPPRGDDGGGADPGGRQRGVQLNVREDETIWVYVPQALRLADEDHPILQSYVDTVCQGCLEWGGEPMCDEFVRLTHDWSPFYLNDTPSSRRPWLFRKEYAVIDRILREHSDRTFLDHRKHPEEFATAFLLRMLRGSWGIPARNPVFIGRDAELSMIHARLTLPPTNRGGSSSCAVSRLDVAGMGGVGKTQLVTEYCYRYFPSYYGLVIWVSARSAESVASTYRQFMAETAGAASAASAAVSASVSSVVGATSNAEIIKDRDTDEVVSEVKARLFRSKVPWLIVFDNLEDPSLLAKFVPHSTSTAGCGHVLVTTRLVDTIDFADRTLILGCFQPEESLELFCRATMMVNNDSGSSSNRNSRNENDQKRERNAAMELAELLGHLPLALGMAAAYMRRCDVSCEEYRSRYVGWPTSTASGAAVATAAHWGGVLASLSLSLNAIQQENVTAWEVLRLLAWLGPDQITKKLLRSLLQTKAAQDAVDKHLSETEDLTRAINRSLCAVAGLSALSVVVTTRRSRSAAIALFIASATAVVALNTPILRTPTVDITSQHDVAQAMASRRESNHPDVFQKVDEVWDILKSFSILVVKEGQGSMHRLLGQALRASQSESESARNLKIGIRTIQKAWAFKPERIDTWNESTAVLELAKAALAHSVERQDGLSLDLAQLSREVGVFSAMALNRFKEAQQSLELSLMILDSIAASNRTGGYFTRRLGTELSVSRASTFHELGRVFRYQGLYHKSEEALTMALEIRSRLARVDSGARHGVAATLYELGVLEVKKHRLDSAANFLQKALDLRRALERESPGEDVEADCAASLHQLAAVHVARRPPSLDLAESLLHEALSLSMQTGQRAATLKQLARVAIRRGDFDTAERSLAQAHELYIELYGDNSLHINVAAVKFQQGALALQREQLDAAWLHFSECLRARKQAYSYSQGNHLEVSTVLHELGCVALTQKRMTKAVEMLTSEREILDQLYESSSSQQRERIHQARLTNLTWLRKCAKAQGNETMARKLANERSALKHRAKEEGASKFLSSLAFTNLARVELQLQQESLRCRLVARQYALTLPTAKDTSCHRQVSRSADLYRALSSLSFEIERYRQSQQQSVSFRPLYEAIVLFHDRVKEASSMTSGGSERSTIIEACDSLRDVFREVGLQVTDSIQRKLGAATSTK